MRVTVTAAIDFDIEADGAIEAGAEAEAWVRTMCGVYQDPVTILDIDVEEPEECR